MNRRAFLAGLGAVLAAPLGAGAQHAQKVYRIGFLRAGPAPTTWVEAFQQGLREHGYVVGQNVLIEFQLTDSGFGQLRQLADELVRSKVDVIVASAGPPALAAKQATTSVPIVFVNVYDPVELGLVPGLRHPGGNITGLAMTSADLTGKRLEVFRGALPKLRRVGVLAHPATPSTRIQLEGAKLAAPRLRIRLEPIRSVDDPADFEVAFKAMRGADGVLVLDSPVVTTYRARVVELANTYRLPAMYGFRELADVGGLISYGPQIPDVYRRAATYVDKILKGAKPADLPIEQPTKFELVINLKTAKALGLTIPASLLLRADQVIE